MPSSFWLRPATMLGIFGFFALLVWPAFGGAVALAVFALCLLLYACHHLRQLERLMRWLSDPQPGTVPDGTGLWEDVFVTLRRLAKRQSASQHQLSTALARFQRAGQAMPDGLIVLDERDIIEWMNHAAEKHWGLDAKRDIGRPVTYLIRQAQFNEYLAAQNYAEPLVMQSIRTPEVTLSLQLIPFGDKQKLLISRDITRFERIETMRRDFIANVSHELRTPLTVVGGFLESLQDYTELSAEERAHFFGLMADQTARMRRLVDDLLMLSRLESASNPLQEERVDVPALVRRVYEEAKGLSQGRHEVTLELESDAWLLGAEAELVSAFGNLVSNAVRYTPPGGSITLRWADSIEGARFSVSDTGIGIEPQHIPRLTERFYRVDRSRSRETGGTGLGLSIVKHVLTRHQARLDIVSKPGEGSTFTAIFPITRVLKPGATAPDQASA